MADFRQPPVPATLFYTTARVIGDQAAHHGSAQLDGYRMARIQSQGRRNEKNASEKGIPAVDYDDDGA